MGCGKKRYKDYGERDKWCNTLLVATDRNYGRGDEHRSRRVTEGKEMK